MYTINRSLMRKMILDSGGIRPFCTRIGINRQSVYNIFEGGTPDYSTICRISEGLGLDGEQILHIFFVREGQAEA